MEEGIFRIGFEKARRRAIFNFSDEDYHNCGRATYEATYHSNRRRISRVKSYTSTQTAFSIMQRGAYCWDIEVRAPIHIWDVETLSQKLSSKQDLEKENQSLKEKIGRNRKKALEPATEEFQALSERNANIQRHNDSLRQSGQSGTKSFKRKKNLSRYGNMRSHQKRKIILIGNYIEIRS